MPSGNTKKANIFNIIRLMAAIQVVLVHTVNHLDINFGLLNILKAFPGVPIFYFVSGFLIWGAYERCYANGLRVFFRNRFLRIFPALWISILIGISIILILGYLTNKDVNLIEFICWLLGQATFFQFYNPDFMRDFGTGVFNGALWTISIELQFYIITPLLYRLYSSARWVFIVLLIFSLITNRWVIAARGENGVFAKLVYVTFLPWVYMYMTGIFAKVSYDIVVKAISKISISFLLALYIVTIILIGSFKTNASNGVNPISFIFLASIILKLLDLNLHFPETICEWINKNDLSYGIYLYHMMVLNVLIYLKIDNRPAEIAVVLLGSLMLSWFSWRLIESPALNLKNNNKKIAF